MHVAKLCTTTDLPELNLSGSYGWRDKHILPEERSEWSLALGLRLPIFTGFQRTYGIKQAKARFEGARASYQRLLRDVELEVWVAYSDSLRAVEALNAAETFVQSSRRNLKAMEGQYRAVPEEGVMDCIHPNPREHAFSQILSAEAEEMTKW